jgi:hypothetical protein
MEEFGIGEFNENAGMRKSEVETIKAVLSTSRIVYVPKYSNHKREVPVNWVYICTTNEPNFLRDHENRRFWVIELTQSIAEAYLSEHNELLLGEAYELFVERKMKPYLDEKWMEEGLRDVNLEYTRELPNQDIVSDYIAGKDVVFLSHVNMLLHFTFSNGLTGPTITIRNETPASANLAVPILRMLGFRKDKRAWTKDHYGKDVLRISYKRVRGEKMPGGNQMVDPIKFLKEKFENVEIKDEDGKTVF